MIKAILSLLLLTGSVSARVDLNIDNGWRFVGGSIDGSTIDEIVNLPHRWNSTDAASGYDYSRGGGTYTNSSSLVKQNGTIAALRRDDVRLVKGNRVILATASIGATVHGDQIADGGSVSTNYLIRIFQWWLKPILVLSLLFAFVAAGQGWKAGLGGWKMWGWRCISAVCALLFVAIIGGWIYGLTTDIDIFEYSLL